MEPSIAPLSDEPHKTFTQITLKRFNDAVAGFHSRTSACYVADVVTAMHKSLTLALVPELRRINARCAATALLPDEMLYSIWKLLGIEDRVAVSQVCSSWRVFALGSRHLWTDLTSPGCNCNTCATTSHTLGVLGRPSLLPELFARSATAKWTLDLTVTPCTAKFIRSFWQVVGETSSKARLDSLTLRVMDPDFPSYFRLPQPLPALRNLTLEWCAGSKGYDDRRRIYIHSIFTNLESIQLGGGYSIHWTLLPDRLPLGTNSFPPHDASKATTNTPIDVWMPKLRTLDCGFRDFDGLSRALECCPQLETLHADLSRFAPQGYRGLPSTIMSDIIPQVISKIQPLLSRLRSITVSNISALTFGDIVKYKLFRYPQMQEISLAYGFTYSQRPVSDGLNILHDLDHPERTVTFLGQETWTMEGTYAAGRKRKVHFQGGPDNFRTVGGTYLNFVTSLFFYGSWSRSAVPVLPPSALMPVFPSAHTVTIATRSAIEFLLQLAPVNPPCPHLENILISNAQHGDRLSLDYTEALQLVKTLKGEGTTIRSLHIGTNTSIRGHRFVLEGIVENVTLS
ncbi:hypothetical protein EXIGLDRAFT_387277 [Exidia glandulosa HHB12029]|uniref:F-box domain-containing protein n=1 Tax=Exidia glandulosa HHB12029 TaxID=1314781 RepID=A0A165L1P8_EXIGL|nr:hypothetical protein EXIGLDRAFT_387277 [Exidia glandulosa HHB12029]